MDLNGVREHCFSLFDAINYDTHTRTDTHRLTIFSLSAMISRQNEILHFNTRISFMGPFPLSFLSIRRRRTYVSFDLLFFLTSVTLLYSQLLFTWSKINIHSFKQFFVAMILTSTTHVVLRLSNRFYICYTLCTHSFTYMVSV